MGRNRDGPLYQTLRKVCVSAQVFVANQSADIGLSEQDLHHTLEHRRAAHFGFPEGQERAHV